MKCSILLISACFGAIVHATGSANSAVRHMYHINSVEFDDGAVKSATVSDFDYDPFTGFLCAAFKRTGSEPNFATIGCFDTNKYKSPATPKFSAFPTPSDHILPHDTLIDEDGEALRSFLVDEEDLAYDLSAELHRQRLYGRKRQQRTSSVVSEEKHHGQEGNEHAKPVKMNDEYVPVPDAEAQTVVPPTLHRKSFNFVSVTRVHFDDCGRLWFLDSGTAFEGTEKEKFYRRPILWAFNLAVNKDRQMYNKLYLRHEIITNVTHNGISDFVVDIHGPKCHDFHVYLADHADHKLIVYDHRAREDYSVQGEALAPIQSEAKHYFLDKEYHFAGGVFSLALGELDDHGYRNVFFTLGSGMGQYVFDTKALHRKKGDFFQLLGYRGCGVNSLNHVYDSYSQVMFYMHPETNSVRCWNANKRLIPENIGTVFVDKRLTTGWSMKVDQANNLWFMANNYNFFTGQSLEDSDTLNLFRGKVRNLIRNTVCDVAPTFYNDPQVDHKDTFDENLDIAGEETVFKDKVVSMLNGGAIMSTSESEVTVSHGKRN